MAPKNAHFRNFDHVSAVHLENVINALALADEMKDAPAFERRVLDDLRRDVGFDAAFMAMKGDPATTVNLDARRLDRAIARTQYARDLAPLKQAAAAQGGVIVDTEIMGETAVRRLDYHRDFAAPIGGRHSLIAFLSLRGRPLGTLMLGRTGRTFTSSDIDRVRALLPELSIARVSYRAPWLSEALPHAPASFTSSLHAPLPLGASSSGAPLASSLQALVPLGASSSGVPIAARGSMPSSTLSPPESVVADLWGRFLACLAPRVPRSSSLERVEHGAADAIVVRDRSGYREMVSVGERGEFVWSKAHGLEPERSGWFYVDLFHLAAARAKNRARSLLLGCGGAVVARQFASVYPGMHMDVVDCNAEVVDLARRWFSLDDIPNLNVTVDDGVAFVARADAAQWDTIIVDAYGDTNLAPSLASRAFFADLRRTLRPAGCFAFNVVGILGEKGVLRDVERAARTAFDDVRLVPVLDPGEDYAPSALRNVVVLGRNA